MNKLVASVILATAATSIVVIAARLHRPIANANASGFVPTLHRVRNTEMKTQIAMFGAG